MLPIAHQAPWSNYPVLRRWLITIYGDRCCPQDLGVVGPPSKWPFHGWKKCGLLITYIFTRMCVSTWIISFPFSGLNLQQKYLSRVKKNITTFSTFGFQISGPAKKKKTANPHTYPKGIAAQIAANAHQMTFAICAVLLVQGAKIPTLGDTSHWLHGVFFKDTRQGIWPCRKGLTNNGA